MDAIIKVGAFLEFSEFDIATFIEDATIFCYRKIVTKTLVQSLTWLCF